VAPGQRDAKVGHHGSAVVEQHVVRFDVAVDHAVAMGVVERGGDFRGDPEGIGDGKLFLAREPVAQRFALDVGHHVEDGAADTPGIEQGQDVGVLEIGGGLDLLQEPLGADERREIGAEHFDRDVAFVTDVLGEIDGGHAAGAQLALEGIAVGQRFLESFERIGHGDDGRGLTPYTGWSSHSARSDELQRP
jgi:hypothetical protein